MTRKNLLAGLMDPTTPTVPPRPAPLQGLGAGGAIGAVSRSIEQIKSQAVIEIEPALIDASLISDRLGSSPEDHAALVASIRDHGQQAPILVRPHPEAPDRYQIAYGRRRLKAIAELGRKVRAMVRPLTDQELVVAQGQENSARTDLSFIEKALFAARLEESGYSRDVIMAALSVDKFALSRLISSAVKVPRDLIEAIGPAPKCGRDRWLELAACLEKPGAAGEARMIAASKSFGGKASDQRFHLIFAAAAIDAPRPSPAYAVKAEDGAVIATVKEDARGVTVAIARKDAGDFGQYLAHALPDLYAAFRRTTKSHSTPTRRRRSEHRPASAL